MVEACMSYRAFSWVINVAVCGMTTRQPARPYVLSCCVCSTCLGLACSVVYCQCRGGVSVRVQCHLGSDTAATDRHARHAHAMPQV
jgi:hypothetical protein